MIEELLVSMVDVFRNTHIYLKEENWLTMVIGKRILTYLLGSFIFTGFRVVVEVVVEEDAYRRAIS